MRESDWSRPILLRSDWLLPSVAMCTTEAVVYNYWRSGNPSLLHHRSFEGYCENITQGAVRVELWVGKCTGQTLGDAYTGWNSVSRIMIEEVSRPQS